MVQERGPSKGSHHLGGFRCPGCRSEGLLRGPCYAPRKAGAGSAGARVVATGRQEGGVQQGRAAGQGPGWGGGEDGDQTGHSGGRGSRVGGAAGNPWPPSLSPQLCHVPQGPDPSPGPPQPDGRRHPRGHLHHPLQGTASAQEPGWVADLVGLGSGATSKEGGAWVRHPWGHCLHSPRCPASPRGVREPRLAGRSGGEGCLAHRGGRVFSGVQGSVPHVL